jgi:hypothetical protein
MEQLSVTTQRRQVVSAIAAWPTLVFLDAVAGGSHLA